MTIANFNHLNAEQKKELLTQCCGSSAWVDKMIAALSIEKLADLKKAAEEKWYECSDDDWLQAFTHHPKIGDINSLKKKFTNTAAWALNEQSGVNTASNKILEELAAKNKDYEKKFGYIFIVCATGKPAEEMLAILQSRLTNKPGDEIKIAAEEQIKITKLRLEKLFA